MDPNHDQLASLFPNIATQLRDALSTLHMAIDQLAPRADREADPELDAKASILDQSYYRLLRMARCLEDAEYLLSDQPLPLQACDLVALVTDIFNRTDGLAPLLGLKMRLVCSRDSLICGVNTDALEQLLFHLLSNALKFTPAGGTVTVELQATEKQVRISVSDTGPGISEDRLSTLFDRYLQSDITDLSPSGLGLGLPLCRCIAQRHGGVLLAESHPGKGSRFTCALPIQQARGTLSDICIDYRLGGFNPTLLALADALPSKAFLRSNQD